MATSEFFPMHAIPPIQCAMCKVLGAKFVCATCGTFYCNVRCQAEDWPTHKDTCMPRLLLATPIIGTAACLEQSIMPVKSIQTSKSNENVNRPCMGSTSPSVVPSVLAVPPPSIGSKTTKPTILPNKGQCVSEQMLVANGAAADKSPSNRGNAIPQKVQQPVNKSATDTDPKCSVVSSVKRMVVNNDQKNVGSAMEKPKKPNTGPDFNNLVGTKGRRASVDFLQQVENNNMEGVGSVVSSAKRMVVNNDQKNVGSAMEKPKQPNTEPLSRNFIVTKGRRASVDFLQQVENNTLEGVGSVVSSVKRMVVNNDQKNLGFAMEKPKQPNTEPLSKNFIGTKGRRASVDFLQQVENNTLEGVGSVVSSAKRMVVNNDQKNVGAAMEKPKQRNTGPDFNNLIGTKGRRASVDFLQQVENNSLKGVGSVAQKALSKLGEIKQQEEELVIKNVINTTTKMSTTDDAARKESTEKRDPKLERITNDKLLQQGPFPEPGSMVKISYVADDMIYIYETGPGPNGERNGAELLIARSLECAQSVKHHLSAPPTVGDIVFAGFDGEYYRAVVKSIKNDIAEVFYPDFGNCELVQWNTLKEIPDPKIKYANCFTHGVWIENIASFTPAIKNFLIQLENEAIFMMITVIEVQNTAGNKMVELYHCSEKYNLSLKLLDLQTSHTNTKMQPPPPPKLQEKTTKFVVTNPHTYKPIFIEQLFDSHVPTGKGIELVITNASYVFQSCQLSVIPKESFTLYKAMMQECEMYGTIDKNPYEPSSRELCLVNTKGMWFRAAALDSNDNYPNLTIYLVDELNFVDDEGLIIRRYPPGLTRKQFVSDCMVENPSVLLDAIDGNKEDADALCGKVIKADIECLKDDYTDETIHLTIQTICK